MGQRDCGRIPVTFRIKNFQTTAANVTDVISNAIVVPNDWVIDKLPQNIRHGFPKETKAFLVKDDQFYQHPHNAIDAAERFSWTQELND